MRCYRFHSESMLDEEVSDSSDWRSITSVSEEAPAASGVSGKHCAGMADRVDRTGGSGSAPTAGRTSSATRPEPPRVLSGQANGPYESPRISVVCSGRRPSRPGSPNLLRSSSMSVSRTNEGRAPLWSGSPHGRHGRRRDAS